MIGLLKNPIEGNFLRTFCFFDRAKYGYLFSVAPFFHVLESMRRYDQLFRDNPPIRVHVFQKRLTIWRGDETRAGNGTVAYAWFVWEKGFSGNPEIFWV